MAGSRLSRRFTSNLVQPVRRELPRAIRSVFGTATEMAFYGRTKVLYQAGAGSFARVYRAIAQDNQEILAVKAFGNVFLLMKSKVSFSCERVV